ncbi:caspase domain-containing protein [Pyronema domesticum]|nr:caspase domain-containing protein [Pyronema domesticum]
MGSASSASRSLDSTPPDLQDKNDNHESSEQPPHLPHQPKASSPLAAVLVAGSNNRSPNHHLPHHPRIPSPLSTVSLPGSKVPDSYIYSTCTGRKRALIIEINPNPPGIYCIDIPRITALLIDGYGFKLSKMRIMKAQYNKTTRGDMQPTRKNIIRSMQWLVKDARPNDSLFFFYSGHGEQMKDYGGDELDGYDECLSIDDTAFVVDDEIHELLVKPLKPGVRLTALINACHSGSMLDLPYMYSPACEKHLIAAQDHREYPGTVRSSMTTTATALDERTSPADVVVWSSCHDRISYGMRTSKEKGTGLFVQAFLTALALKPKQSYGQLLNSINRELSCMRYKKLQSPRLSCSHPLGK